MSQSRFWCFTLNNYDDDDIARLEQAGDSVSYLCFGKEVGDSGTPHLQGTVVFKKKVRFSGVKSVVGDRAHVEVCRRLSESIDYCKKDGDFTEIGTVPVRKAGHSTPFEAFKGAVASGEVTSLVDAREKYPGVYARYPRWCIEYLGDAAGSNHKVEVFPLRVWQASVNEELKLEACPRRIKFVVDPVGNSGKTWFARYYQEYVSDQNLCQIMEPGRRADMAHALKETIRVLFMDAPRSKQGEYIQYDFLEAVKNGLVFSGKYESRVKRLGPVHVVVFMNEDPCPKALSEDRYDILRITPASLSLANSLEGVPENSASE